MYKYTMTYTSDTLDGLIEQYCNFHDCTPCPLKLEDGRCIMDLTFFDRLKVYDDYKADILKAIGGEEVQDEVPV